MWIYIARFSRSLWCAVHCIGESPMSDVIVYSVSGTTHHSLPPFPHTVCGWLNIHMTDLCFTGGVGWEGWPLILQPGCVWDAADCTVCIWCLRFLWKALASVTTWESLAKNHSAWREHVMQKTDDWMKPRPSVMHVKSEPDTHLPPARNIGMPDLRESQSCPYQSTQPQYSHTDLSALLISHGHLRHRRTNIIIILCLELGWR